MICRNCGTDCPEGAMNCVTCGAPLYVEQQQYYAQQPMQQPTGVPGKGLGVAGMVLGIISLVFICFVPYVALICAIVGLILSIVGMAKAKGAGMKNGMAVAGLVCSIISLALTVLSITILAAFFASLF